MGKICLRDCFLNKEENKKTNHIFKSKSPLELLEATNVYKKYHHTNALGGILK